jgi:hypothetical protein
MKNKLSDAAIEWLSTNYSYSNPWHMNSQTVWDVLQKAKSGNTIAIEIWENYRAKVRFPEAKDMTVKSYGELVQKIYNV